MERLDNAINYLLTYKYDNTYNLIFGGTTVDWGDVQHGGSSSFWDPYTYPSIDIYDNAMFVLSLNYYLKVLQNIDNNRYLK